MSVTANYTNGDIPNGTPSSWSSAIDYELFNCDKKTFCISAGNVDYLDDTFNYISSNINAPIENPAQSWNAITIGAYTQKDTITDEEDEYIDYDDV